MSTLIRCITISVCFLVCYSRAVAQVPSHEQIMAELNGQFATSAPVVQQRLPSHLRQRVLAVLFRQADFLSRKLHTNTIVPESLILTDGKSGEHSIRPNSNTALGLAILYRGAPDFPTTFTREQCLENTIRILRFLVNTHGAGGVTCADGKHWRNQWQSAFWACSTGRAAWLVWDQLSPELRWLAARTVCDEADRFMGKAPPAQMVHDTKAEENAWNATVIALAACMFPKHPHASQWEETAIQWTVSAFARPADLLSTTTLDGRPLKDWLSGPNVFDDYTLENHDRVHPDYMTTMKKPLAQSMYYTLAGKKPPAALRFNTREIYRNLKIFTTPDGSFHYPNGQDWGLHREAHWFHPHIQQAVFYGDSEAAHHARACLDTTERMLARNPEDGIFHPDEFRFPSTQHMVLEEMAEAYLLMLLYGDGPEPAPAHEVLSSAAGQHLFSQGKFAVLRSVDSISSFAWGPQVMGLAGPLGKDLLLAPNERSLVGILHIEGLPRERPRVIDQRAVQKEKFFSVCGVISRGGGAAEQRFGYVWLPDGRVFYADQVKQTTTSAIRRLELGTLSVLNEKNWVYHDGDRVLHHPDGEHVFSAEGPVDDPPVTFDSPWFNLDGKLGIHCLHTTGKQIYHPNHRQGNGRLEQFFHLNSVDPESAQQGDVLATTFILLEPSAGPEATRKAASRIQSRVDAPAGLFRADVAENGAQIEIDLKNLVVEYN